MNEFKKLLLVPKVGGDHMELSRTIIQRIKDANAKTNNPFTIIDKFESADVNTLVVPVGGDGTLVYAAKQVVDKGAGVLGMNLGKVGFLTDEMPTDIDDFVYRLQHHEFDIDHRILMSVDYGHHSFLALNDFVISDVLSDSIINYNLQIGDHLAGNHTANSVMVATPTGSTAYPMSVGGPIIYPHLDVLEIIAVAPLSMSTRPIIVGTQSYVTVTVNVKKGRSVSLKADGMECSRIYGIDKGDTATISVKAYPHKTKMVHFKGTWNFFEKMTTKMGWNSK